MTNPLDGAGAIDGDDVKPAWQIDRVALKIIGRSRGKARLFAWVDTCRSAAETSGCTKADFNKHQCLAIAHHQVQLTALATHIAGDMVEAFPLQITAGLLLLIVAEPFAPGCCLSGQDGGQDRALDVRAG